MKRFAISIAIVCLMSFLGATASAKDTWVRVQSKNFRLVGNARESEIREVGRRLESFREVFARLFTNVKITSPVPTTVIVFKSDSSYRPFKAGSNTVGFFQSGEDVNYITLTTELDGSQDAFNIIFHEYTHLLVNNTSGVVPTWFNEGLAEYYSTLTIDEDQKVRLGRPIPSHVYLLRERRMLPLRTLFEVDSKSPYYNETAKQSVFYAQAWALVHYMILGRGGHKTSDVTKFVDRLLANAPVEEAFNEAFGMTIDQMEKHLHDYIKRDFYPVFSGVFKNKLEADAEMHTTPVSEAEALAYLGDLLIHGNRKDGEVYLRKALALDPNLPMAHASLGILRIREGKPDEAFEHLATAALAGSDNHLVHYYYAYALSRQGHADQTMVTYFVPGNVQKMRDHLKKAIELRPDYLDTYGLLAFVNLVTGKETEESIEMLRGILARAPRRNDLLFVLAQLYERKEEFQAARELLQRLISNNPDEELLSRARSVMSRIAVAEKEQVAIKNTEGPLDGPKLPVMPETDNDGRTPPPPEIDPSYFLRQALLKPKDGESQIHGLLQRVDCESNAVVFVIRDGGRAVRLRAETFRSVDMRSFSADAGRQITCGARKPENAVVVIYEPSTDARLRIDGKAKSIEFVPKDFQLMPPAKQNPK